MKPHQIKVEDLQDYEFEHVIVSQCGRDVPNKQLSVRVTLKGGLITYQVRLNGEIVFVAGCIYSAIKEYNNIK
jgi:hypothetical protein